MRALKTGRSGVRRWRGAQPAPADSGLLGGIAHSLPRVDLLETLARSIPRRAHRPHVWSSTMSLMNAEHSSHGPCASPGKI